MNGAFVSFEGGPIIIGPAESLAGWGGVESEDYEFLCSLFDSDPGRKVIALPKCERHSVAVDFGAEVFATSVNVESRGQVMRGG